MMNSGWILISLLALWGPQSETPHRQDRSQIPGWCGTGGSASPFTVTSACYKGPCDQPGNRDAWIPGSGQEIKTLRLRFAVLAEDDGSNPAATLADVDSQMAQINADFLPSGIQFVHTTDVISDSGFRQVFNDSQVRQMKNAHNLLPEVQCNVYVTDLMIGFIGQGTFPWDGQAQGPRGGIIIDENFFGAGQKTMTHELGHNLGLWHTHHGVSEVGLCGGCYERADGTNADTTGDLCSDTAPTPVNYQCFGPGTTDSCSNTPWGATDPQNYMGYGSDWCTVEFTPQQFGRMHCWLEDELRSWLYVCQTDYGFGGPGNVSLSLCGQTLESGHLSHLLLEGAPSFSIAAGFFSFAASPTPFQGGTLVPLPTSLIVLLPTGPTGRISVPNAEGGGGPLTAYLQFVVLDDGQPLGYALSNALELELLP